MRPMTVGLPATTALRGWAWTPPPGARARRSWISWTVFCGASRGSRARLRPGSRPTATLVAPGLVDLHAHFREPGNEDAETVATGLAAAAHGGFTTVCLMPNTTPAIDEPSLVARVRGGGGRVRLPGPGPRPRSGHARAGR